MRRLLLSLVIVCAWLALPSSAYAQCDETATTFEELRTLIEDATAANDGEVFCINAGDHENNDDAIDIPERPGAAAFITVTTTGGCPDRRVTLSDASSMARLKVTDGSGADTRILETNAKANWWKFECLMFSEVDAGADAGAYMYIGSNAETVLGNAAYKIHFDRVVVDPPSGQGEQRGIWVGLIEDFALTRSHIGAMHGTETQGVLILGAVCDPCLIDDTYFGSSTESIMAGGGDPAVTDLNPINITITDSEFYRDPAEYGLGTYKHMIEFKQGINTYVARNTFTNNPINSSYHGTAPAVFYSVRNQGGGCEGCWTHTGLVENNLMINVGQCFQVIGEDELFPSEETYDITFRNNVCETQGNNEGSCWQVGHSPDDITISNNTCVYLDVEPFNVANLPFYFMGLNNADAIADVLVMNDNIIYAGRYGINIDSGTDGEAALEAYFTDWSMEGNIVFGLEEADQTFEADWPEDNTFVTKGTIEAAFIDFNAKNYCVNPLSAYYGKGADCSQIPALAGGSGASSTPKYRLRFRLGE